ncbi:MAG: hypothetical protein M3Q97_04080 [Bacteroidota bacterium]|nr:hypothetical protein [Bacteroidota bacterium]
MKKSILILLAFLSLCMPATAQKGFQLGVGMGYFRLKPETSIVGKPVGVTKEYNFSAGGTFTNHNGTVDLVRTRGKDPVYLELLLSYAFSKSFSVSMPLAYSFRIFTHDFNQGKTVSEGNTASSAETERFLLKTFNIPVMLNYRYPLFRERRVYLFHSLGYSFDHYNFNLQRNRQPPDFLLSYQLHTSPVISSHEISTDYTVYSNRVLGGSLRIGTGIEKAVTKNGGRLQLYLEWVHVYLYYDSDRETYLYNDAQMYIESDFYYYEKELPFEERRNENLVEARFPKTWFNLQEGGLRTSLRYYFGTFTLNKQQ